MWVKRVCAFERTGSSSFAVLHVLPESVLISTRVILPRPLHASPLILRPFNDPLPIPTALRPTPKSVVDKWASPPAPDNQDFVKKAQAKYKS